MTRRLGQLLAATLLGVAAVAAVPVGPASAAACSAGSGVTVVVNGAVGCDSSGGGTAMSNFRDAGHTLQDYHGFVCRIDGAPSAANACSGYPPADAYWGLFWSNGTSGTWTYSSEGAGSLNVPNGGWVAFVWQDSNTKRYPAMKPVSAAPAPAPTKKPAPKPARTTSSAAAAKPSPSASPSTAAEKKQAQKVAKKKAAAKKATAEKKKAAAAATTTPTPAEPTTSEADLQNASDSSESTGGLWAGAAIAVALLAGMGGVLWRRRAAGRSS